MSRKHQAAASHLAKDAVHHPLSKASIVLRQAADDGNDSGTRGDEPGPGPGIMDRPVAFKRGGGVDHIDGMKPKKHRLDRPKRARRERFAEGGVPSSSETPFAARIEARNIGRPGAGAPLDDKFGMNVRLPQPAATTDSGPEALNRAVAGRPYGVAPAPRGSGHTIPHPPPAFVEPPPEPIDWDKLYYGRRFARARGGRTRTRQ